MRNILIATDLSERSDNALQRALALARERGAELSVLHVVDGDLPREMIDTLHAAAKDKLERDVGGLGEDLAARVTLRIEVGDAVEQIINSAWSCQADLIVIGLHRRRWLRDLMLGATLERLLRLCDRPILVVRDAATTPYQRVLVAVDFSVGSRRAYEASVRLAPEGRFELVHAFETPFAGFLTSQESHAEAAAQHAREFERMVEQELNVLAETLADAPKPELVLMHGEPLNVILDRIAREQPDLLAVGTHGRAGIARAVLGSVVRLLLREPPCDVLAVRG